MKKMLTLVCSALTGRGDGENYQVGLVDICDTPYTEMVEAIRASGERLYEWHRGASLESDPHSRGPNQ